MSQPGVDADQPVPDRASTRALAEEIDRRIRELPDQKTEPIRRVRREYSQRLRPATGRTVVDLAHELVDKHRWVAYELVCYHPNALSRLSVRDVERLGGGIDDWVAVDTFCYFITGPAWRIGVIDDQLVRRWAASSDRWWRRSALVSTVPLNIRARGGTGEPARTLDICARLVRDRDDMVVKALSWALRALVIWDADAVRAFLNDHRDVLAARVVREVDHKLGTGLKNPNRARKSGLYSGDSLTRLG